MNADKIVKDHEKMIWKIASHFYGVDKNDLYQAGVVGLLKALKNYKNDGLTKFSSYAYDYIFGEMYLLSCNKDIKISKDILKLYKKIEESRYKIAQQIGKVPNNLELSEYLGLSLDDINLAMMSATTILSLDATLAEEDSSLYNIVSLNESNLDTKIIVDDSFKVLSDEEKDIIKSRYFEDLTQSEVAKKLNMTQVMVSRYEKKGLNKMRDFLQI